MCGWRERNRECAAAWAGEGRLMASASMARSAVVACGEYPGATVCALIGTASVSARSESRLIILRKSFFDLLVVELVERRGYRFAEFGLAPFALWDAGGEGIELRQHFRIDELLIITHTEGFERANR